MVNGKWQMVNSNRAPFVSRDYRPSRATLNRHLLFTIYHSLLQYLKINPLRRRPLLFGRERVRDDDLKNVVAGRESCAEPDARADVQVLQVGLLAGVERRGLSRVNLLAVAEEAHLRLQLWSARRVEPCV